MTPNSRSSLKQYILQELGSPVSEVNIDDAQLENQIDKALEFFQDYHADGTQRAYIRKQVTATVITVTDSSLFERNELCSGSFGTMCTVFDAPTPTTLRIITQGQQLPQVNEVLTGTGSNQSQTITNIVYGDIDNEFISVPNSVTSVMKVFPMTTSIYGSGIFDIRYQMRLNDLFDLYSTEMVYYTNVMQHLDLIDFTLVVDKQFEFNRYTNKLYIDQDWKTAIYPDEFIIYESMVATDPNLYGRLYGDRMLKALATAYAKKQWGMNLKKFNGLTILGGLTLNGQVIYEEALDDIKDAEEKIKRDYQRPAFFRVG